MEEEFKVKSLAELEKMAPEQKEAYVKAKAKYDLEQAKEVAKEAAKEVAKDLIEKAQENKEKPLTSKEIIESEEFKTALANAEKAIQDKLDLSIEDIGKNQNNETTMKAIDVQFKEAYSNLGYKEEEKPTVSLSKQEKGEYGELFRLQTKAFDTLNVHTVNDVSNTVYPNNGTVSAIGQTLRTFYSRFVGFFSRPRPYSKIMDLVSYEPLSESKLLMVSESHSGSFEVTPECELKPVIKLNFDAEEVDSEPVAALWYTTLKIRRFYSGLLQRFRNYLGSLLAERIPDHVLSQVKALATPITLDPVFATDSDPNIFDAIISIVSQLQSEGYMVDAFSINPKQYGNMRKLKGTDGHYMLKNGGSIQLVNGSIDYDGQMIELVKDPSLDVDEWLCGDFAGSIVVGLDEQILYFETDGRTDGESTAKTGLALNIRTHELAQFVAVGIPKEKSGGVKTGTFTDVIAQITA